ncbi:MAG: IclR family transcriptional regulator, partial [Phycisphaeraceae bacterium]|nr:IclR family transcriptional regulator [Phycisphaeraceae bacterium]
HPEGLSQSEIVERLELPKNSVFRITMTLLGRGYLDRDEATKRFTPTRKMIGLGCSAMGDRSLVEKAWGIMCELRDRTKETVLLGTVLDHQGVVLEQAPGTHPFKFLIDLGFRFDLHTAAPGKAMLAFMSETDRRRIIEAMTFPRRTERTITSAREFEKELERVRQHGYGIDWAEDVEGQHCLAAPVFNEHSVPVASLWITAPSARIPHTEFESTGRVIIEHARRISRRLGHTPTRQDEEIAA